MKIVSFVRRPSPKRGAASVEHGIVLDDGASFVDAAGIAALRDVPSDGRLNRLLTMEPAERARIVAELPRKGEPLDSVTLQSASPFCPLYLLMHGNTPIIFKRQHPESRWQFPRIPYVRIRPWTSHLGHGEEFVVPEGGRLNHGAELGVVIGKPAYRVPEDQAANHIAGFTVTNDGSLHDLHKEFMSPPEERISPYQATALATLYKAADGSGMMGPWITTAEEVGDHYDLLLYTYNDGQRQNRSWSGSYLMLAEFLIAYFSRFMTLPTGTAISLAAAGWDGSSADLPHAIGSRRSIEVEIEKLGKLRTTVRRVGAVTESPLIARLKSIGLPARRPPSVGPAVWMLRSGYRESDVFDGIPVETGMCPHLYPPGSLADCVAPLVLPPHAADIRCSVQLAVVIGKPVYRATPQNALDFVAGAAPILAVRDTSLSAALHSPTAYELRASYFLGCCGDGFFRLGATRPLREIADLSHTRMRLSAPGIGEMEYTTADYRFGFAEMITIVSRIGTLTPGDVLSLGVAGRELVLPAARIGEARKLVASVAGLDEIVVSINDERDPAWRDPEPR